MRLSKKCPEHKDYCHIHMHARHHLILFCNALGKQKHKVGQKVKLEKKNVFQVVFFFLKFSILTLSLNFFFLEI